MSKIKDGLNLPANKNGRVEIPDVSRRHFPRFLARDMKFKKGVEIGVQRGYFTRRLAAEGMEIYGVDPWKSYMEYYEYPGYQKKQDAIYQNALDNTRKYPNCHLIRKTSMDALNDFEDNSLDFVYIDGHHGFKFVAEDIYEWTKKVRKGGIISGHDYAFSRHKTNPYHPYILQVRYVVDAYVAANKPFISKWYVLGAKKKTKENESRDQYRSWFWFKEW